MAGRGQTATKGAAGSAKRKNNLSNVMVPVEKEQLKQMHPAKRLVSVPVAKKQMNKVERSDIGTKLNKAKQQGYKAAKENKIFPRELQNTTNGSWEDAKLYDKNTRQGQNYWQDHMKGMSQIQRQKQTRNYDTQRGNRAKAPTPPTPSPVPKRPSTTSQANKETVRRYEDAFASKKKKK